MGTTGLRVAGHLARVDKQKAALAHNLFAATGSAGCFAGPIFGIFVLVLVVGGSETVPKDGVEVGLDIVGVLFFVVFIVGHFASSGPCRFRRLVLVVLIVAAVATVVAVTVDVDVVKRLKVTVFELQAVIVDVPVGDFLVVGFVVEVFFVLVYDVFNFFVGFVSHRLASLSDRWR
jgi:hypothetical protein